MSDYRPPTYNSEWESRPQAGYPAQPGPYNAPQQPARYYDGPPPQPYPQPQQPYPQPQQPYPQQNIYQQPAPQYQAPPVPINVNVYNTQNQVGYHPQEVYDPHRGAAVATLTLGIVALCTWIVPFVGSAVSIICAIIGFFLFFQGRKSITRRGSAITGFVFCIIVLSIEAIMIALFGTAIFTLLLTQGSMR